MAIIGYKTRSAFKRYNTVSDSDLKEAVRKLETTIALPTATTLATLPDDATLTPRIH
jgi:hypothetical protein